MYRQQRWDGTVGAPEIQKFAGALQGQRAKKGIFITMSDFTKEANDYAAMIDSRIVLINGVRLCNLMIDHGIEVHEQLRTSSNDSIPITLKNHRRLAIFQHGVNLKYKRREPKAPMVVINKRFDPFALLESQGKE